MTAPADKQPPKQTEPSPPAPKRTRRTQQEIAQARLAKLDAVVDKGEP